MSVNEKELDQIIQSAEHTKDLPLKPQIWERIESKLDVDAHKRRSERYRLFSYISSAACIVLLIGAFICFCPKLTDSKQFTVETLEESAESNSVFSVEYTTILDRNTFSCKPC